MKGKPLPERFDVRLDPANSDDDYEIASYLYGLPWGDRSAFIRAAILAYIAEDRIAKQPAASQQEVDRLWQTIEAQQRQIDLLIARPATSAPPAQPSDTVAASGLDMGGPRRQITRGVKVVEKVAEFDPDIERQKLLGSIHKYGGGEK
jgi:hypothetical protein